MNDPTAKAGGIYWNYKTDNRILVVWEFFDPMRIKDNIIKASAPLM